jgi:broad specificity phosphatase PhoE
MSPTITLIRHGRSGHVHSGWITAAEFIHWREAYEAAGVDPEDVPPEELRETASTSGVLVASTVRRAIESAKALAPDREVLTSPLLRELDLPPPELGRVRLPLMGWALMFGVRWLVLGHRHFTTEEVERARVAAEWLRELSAEHGSVVVVTHASFRSLLGRELMKTGWRSDVARPTSRHWSAWSFTRR